MRDLFRRLDILARQDNLEEVERVAREALESAAGADAEDLWRYVSWACFESGRYRESLAAARRAHDALYQAKAHFHLWQLDDALAALEGFSGSGEDAAEATWYRGLLEEFFGGDPMPYYRRAAALAPELYGLPVRLSDREVDAVVQSALAGLPPRIRKAIENTVVEVRPLPRPHPDVDPLTLGTYFGRSLMERSVEDAPALPAHIELFRANIERIASDRDHAVEELRITLLHEVGHHLGFDEEGVARLGLE
jgi:predicted Zn-dependent protease with MMP-like domain